MLTLNTIVIVGGILALVFGILAAGLAHEYLDPIAKALGELQSERLRHKYGRKEGHE